jgi:HlyD family secretion protein
MTRLNVIVLGTAATLIGAGVLLLVTAPRDRVAGIATNATPQAVALRVPALKVVRRSERNRIEVPGVVKPIRRVLLAAETAGRIEALGAQEHDVVRAGQVILGLEDTIHKAAVNRTEAAVTRTRAAHRLAELELERHERLFRQGVASAAELDRARSEERATFGALGEAEAMLDEARELLTKTTIRAPFDGVLTAFDREVGDRVEIGEQIA